MDLLRTAVVDITTLVSTSHALTWSAAADGPPALKPRLRRRLRREIKRGTVAYIDTLARAKRGIVDEALLAACRVAAERPLVQAVRHQVLLGRMLSSQAGALTGVAAARQDLWRLAHIATHLRLGLTMLRDSRQWADDEPGQTAGTSLRRRLRKALVAYARAMLRDEGAKQGAIVAARKAAWAEVGKRGAAHADRLAAAEAAYDAAHTVIRQGVAKPLLDLSLDWRGQ